jgi:hypothetical protein
VLRVLLFVLTWGLRPPRRLRKSSAMSRPLECYTVFLTLDPAAFVLPASVS